MKYTHEQFDATVKCFDETIRRAKASGKTIDFVCSGYDGDTCPNYCPMRRLRLSECLRRHGANRWQSLKEQFIIENEPKD